MTENPIREALLDAYIASLPPLQAAELRQSVERITAPRPGWPIQRGFDAATVADNEGRN